MSGFVSREQIAVRLSAWQDHHVRTKRAGLVQRAEDWRWGSFNRWLHKPERDSRRLSLWAIACPPRWGERINKPLTGAELHAACTSVNRGTPLGDETWVHRTATQPPVDPAATGKTEQRVLRPDTFSNTSFPHVGRSHLQSHPTEWYAAAEEGDCHAD